MVTYTVDLPITISQTGIYQTRHDLEVTSRILAYNSTNPLGISASVNWIVIIYFPALIIAAGTLNTIAIFTLRSNFLGYLVIQPLIRTLLYLHNLLLLVGPFYIWLAQCCNVHLNRNQVYPCFLLLWGHNFAALATSSVLVAMIIERSLSIGRPEMLWDIWRKACRNTVTLLLIGALVLAVGGMMCIDGTMEDHKVAYPICLPWWDNEHGSVSPLWYKIMAFNFSIGPSFLILLSMGMLMLSVIRFKQLMRSGMEALNHYNSLYLEIRSTLHMKFVTSVWWLGSLFIIFSSPLGLFIIFGPAIYNRMIIGDNSVTDTASTSSHSTANKGVMATWENNSTITKDANVFRHQKMSSLEYSYLLVSRSDTETVLWIAYYSLTLLTVPVLLTTEVLFRRECKSQLVKAISALLCRSNQSSRWSGCDVHECDNGNLIGPYIAKNDEQSFSIDRLGVFSKTESMKIYDAGKAERAGRRLERKKCESNKYVFIQKTGASKFNLKNTLSAKNSSTEYEDGMLRKSFIVDIAVGKNVLLSSINANTKNKLVNLPETCKVVQHDV